jgi:hypothetical protein
MKSLLLTVLITLGLSFSVQAETPEEKGFRLAKENEKANTGFVGELALLKMILINAHGDKTTRKMKSYIKERDNEGDYSINEFLWPADVKGTKLLTHAYKEKDDDQWLYMPAIKRVKRISSRNKSGSFMGSEFSYEDMGSQEPEKFTYKFIKQGKMGKHPVAVVERYPKDKNSAYSKQVTYEDTDRHVILKVEYFDRKGELLKVASFSNVKKVFKDMYRAHKIHMKNVQTKKESILTWSKRKLGAKLPDSKFQSTKLAGDAF